MTRDEWSQLVMEWQGPLYNLALRVVGNRDDAADATQEVFMALFANWRRYDAARPLKPWLYRLAHNTLLNFARGRGRAHAAATAAPPRSEADGGAERREHVERDETRRAVEAGLNALPAEARTLLLLHYFHDLSQVELSEILDVPRTTLQSRLSGALGALRDRLATAGYLAALPLVETVMRSATPVAVPQGVTASLLKAAATASAAAGAGAAATSAVAITMGGIMITKKVAVVVLGVVMLCSVGVGWLAARGTTSPGGNLHERLAGHGDTVSREEYDALRAKHDALSGERNALAAEKARLKREMAALAASGGGHGGAVAEVAASPTAGEPEATATEPGDLDWTRFAALFAERVDDISAAIDGQPNPESEAAIYEAIAELSRLSNAARAKVEQPLYDPEILRGFARAIFGDSLDLDETQLRDLDHEVEAVLARTTAGVDLADMGPAERTGLRERLMGNLMSAVEGIADEEQQPRLESIRRIMDKILSGNRRDLEIAVGEQGDAEVASRVAEEWRKGFRLTAEALPRLTPVAGEFWRDVKSLLDRYGQRPGDSRALTEAEQTEIRQQTNVLQIVAERKILDLLSQSELANVRDATPVLFAFNYRGEERIEERRGHGYF